MESAMDATTDMPTAWTELDRSPRFAGKPARWASPLLGAAMDQLAEYRATHPDATLGELRAALLGTGFTWSPDGKREYSADRVALIDELDELIEVHGWNARGAELYL